MENIHQMSNKEFCEWKVLVVDHQVKSFTSLRSGTENVVSPVEATGRRETCLKLKDKSEDFYGVFINFDPKNPLGLSVLRDVHQHRAGIPVYLLHDGKAAPFGDDMLEKLGVQEFVEKPLTYSKMISLIAPMIGAAEARIALDVGRRDYIEKFQDIKSDLDDEFIPVKAMNFLSGRFSQFDVYIRLPSGRYLKLLSKGDEFDHQRLINYFRKGIDQFYLKRDSQEEYLIFCDQVSKEILRARPVPTEIKIRHTLNLGDQTMSYIKTCGLSRSSLAFAENFVQGTGKLIDELNLKQHDVVNEYLCHASGYEHGVSASIIASLMIRNIGFNSPRFQNLVGLSAMFHDIGLYSLFPAQDLDDEDLLQAEHREKFEEHPEVGAEILANIFRVDPIISEAVAQHHEKRDGSGFPRRKDTGNILTIAQVIGIADEFAQLIAQARTTPRLDPRKELNTKIFDRYSFSVIEAFRKTFL